MSVIYAKYHINKQLLPREDLVQMQNELNYWKPDDMGIWKNNYIGLGHLMLWNTPESLQEKLPLKSKYSENVITANARIDNRTELFIPLKITDHSIPDSTLILAAYDKWGRDCVKHLEGDFAFLIWDVHREELFCVRDHLGIKPLYYHLSKDVFLISSEIRGFAHFIKNLSLNKDYLLHNLAYLPLLPYETSIKEVYEFPPAHYFVINKDGLTKHQYWDLDPTYQQPIKKTKEYAKELEFLLKKSVQQRLRTAFPVGSELSGGLDSGIVTSMSYQLYEQKNQFHTYSHTLPNHLRTNIYPAVDEQTYIKNIIDYLNIKNTHFQKDVHNCIDLIKGYLDTFKIPFNLATAEMIHPNAKVAAKDNVRTLLSGFLGDEGISFRGGNPPIELLKEKRWGAFSKYALPYLLTHPKKVINAIYKRTKNVSTINSLRDFRKAESFLASDQLMEELLNKPKFVALERIKNHRYKQYNLLKNPMASNRFSVESIIAQQHHVEMRYPLASKPLLEYFLSLPLEQKKRNGVNRYIFREVLKNWLPHDFVMSEKRRPFSLPIIHPSFISTIPELLSFFEERKDHVILENLNLDKILLKIRNTEKISDQFKMVHGYERLRYLIMSIIYLEYKK